MPQRRSVARNTATPARSLQGGSVVPSEISVTRRTTRRAAQQPGAKNDVVNNPQLPELQTQQSYAYGSTKTPLLPEQLVAREKMSLSQIADTIDAGVRQADKHFESHVVETRGALQQSPEPKPVRQGQPKVASRQPSANPEKLPQLKKDMIEAWADSLDSSNLEDIEEEDSSPPETPDYATRKDTDPSSFPSGIFDHSYNYERGWRQPQPARGRISRIAVAVQDRWDRLESQFVYFRKRTKDALLTARDWFDSSLRSIARAGSSLLASSFLIDLAKMALGLLLIWGVSLAICQVYTKILCDPTSSSAVSLTLQNFCGQCTASPFTSLNLTEFPNYNSANLASAIRKMQTQMSQLEQRINQKIDSKIENLDSLKRELSDLSDSMSKLQHRTSQPSNNLLNTDSVPSPLIPKINFFAPSNGALIDPYRTSPTKRKPFSWLQRNAMRAVGLKRYQSRAPMTALESWHDVGECWCSADSPTANPDLARLGITVKELIYPTEIVLEHYPAAGSLSPDTAPKTVELWADFKHLDTREWERLNIRQMQADAPLGKDYALLGKMEYDASNGVGHVQVGRLDVNQFQYGREGGDGMMHYARHFVVRVTASYGAAHVCLYRVRLHGEPVRGRSE